MPATARDRLVDRLRARFAGRFPAEIQPGRGYSMMDCVHTWRGSVSRWRALKALLREYEAEWAAEGVTVEILQVQCPPAWRLSGRRLRVVVELSRPREEVRRSVE